MTKNTTSNKSKILNYSMVACSVLAASSNASAVINFTDIDPDGVAASGLGMPTYDIDMDGVQDQRLTLEFSSKV